MLTDQLRSGVIVVADKQIAPVESTCGDNEDKGPTNANVPEINLQIGVIRGKDYRRLLTVIPLEMPAQLRDSAWMLYVISLRGGDQACSLLSFAS